MSTICFRKISKKDMDLIGGVLKRFERTHREFTHMENLLDLMNCQEGVCPLNLELLLGAEDNDFFHDMLGIKHYIDRQNKVMTDGFLPRCAKEGI